MLNFRLRFLERFSNTVIITEMNNTLLTDESSTSFSDFLKQPPIKSSEKPVHTKLQILPLTSLGWREFEQLCCRVIEQEDGIVFESIHLYGVPGDDQKGIDIVAQRRINGDIQVWCYQCKNHKYFSPGTFRKAVNALEYQADYYVFLLASEAQSSLRDIANKHENIYLWDEQDISRRLKRRRDVVSDFFHPAWAEAFCVSDIAPGNPYRPPVPYKIFVGREEDVSRLQEALANERFILIQGIGGIGKTQVLLQSLAKFSPESTIWLNVEAFEKVADLSTAVAVAIDRICEIQDQTISRIVFDGLEHLALREPDRITDFLLEIHQSEWNLQIVVTSQVELSIIELEAFRYLLRGLPAGVGVHLLEAIVMQSSQQVRFTTSDLEELCHWCKGHPLSLKLIGGLLCFYGQAEAVISLLNRERTKALSDPHRGNQKRSTSVHICLAMIHDELSHAEKRLLQFLSNFPSGCSQLHLTLREQSQDASPLIARLRQFFLIEEREDSLGINRFHLINPVRDFVRYWWHESAYEEGADIQMETAQIMVIESALLNSYTHTKDASWGIFHIEIELPNYLYAINYGGWGVEKSKERGNDPSPYLEIIAALAGNLSTYFFVRGEWRSAQKYLLVGAEAAEELGEIDEATNRYFELFIMQSRFYAYKQQAETLEKLQKLATRIKEGRIQIIVRIVSGMKADSEKMYSAAIEHFGAAIAIINLAEESIQKQADLGFVLALIGRTYEHSKQYERALEANMKALSYYESIRDKTNIGNICHHIGNCHAHFQNHSEAVRYYVRAIKHFALIGHTQHLSNSMSELADVVVQLGLSDDLRMFLTEGLLSLGLEDALQEVKLLLSYILSDEEFQSGFEEVIVARKLFQLVKLISFTEYTPYLVNWATELFTTYIEPLLEESTNFVWLLTTTIRIAEIAHYTGKLIEDKVAIGNEHVETLCVLVSDFSDSISNSSTPYEWLARWLQHVGFSSTITGADLKMAVFNTKWLGHPFEI